MKELREAFVIENRGEKIFGVLHLPEGIKDCPIVIIMHGYASTKVGTNRSHVKLAMKLAQEGIGCCRFDFRGAGDSEGDMASMNLEDLCSDASAIFEFVRNKGFKKVGLFGSSLGGSIAVVLASRQKVDALALWAPVASGVLWLKDWKQRQKGVASSLETYQGVFINEEFKREFGNFRADQLLELLANIPLLHMQGEKDEVVTICHAQAFQKARSNAGATTFIQYQDAEHQLGRSKVFSEVILEICRFFNTYL